MRALSPYVGLAVFHLSCSPAGGDVASPAAVCGALGRDPGLVWSPQPLACGGGPTSWFDVTISGRLDGKPLHRTFSTCWTRQSPTLATLGIGGSLNGHIRPRRQGTVLPGVPQTFGAGALRPGDLVVCRILGHDLKLGIPDRTGSIGSMGFGGAGVATVTLSGMRRADGSVTGSCHKS